jgi:cellulose biosynthesis protein BcsQ
MTPVIAFYAYKGGTGRTLALLHAARVLAREGRRIVVLDLDLGAPSIWPMLVEGTPEQGFVEFAGEWLAGRFPEVETYLHAVQLDPKAAGSLFMMSSGRMDQAYLERLQGLEWGRLIERRRVPSQEQQQPLHGREQDFFQYLRERLAASVAPDAVFIDAPTGLSDTSNVCLRVLADVVVVIFSPTQVQLEGVGRVVGLLTEEHRASDRGPDVFCVASTLMARRVTGAQMMRVQRAFAFLDQVRYDALDRPDLRDEENAARIEQSPAVISYDPVVAELERLETSVEPPDIEAAVYEDLLGYVRQCVPERSRLGSPADLDVRAKQELLAEMRPLFEQFAEAEDKLDRYFLRSTHLDRLHAPSSVVILGGKGSGKTALFTYALGRAESNVVHRAVHGKQGSMLAPDQLSELGRRVTAMDVFWRIYALAQTEMPATGATAEAAVSAVRRMLSGGGDLDEAAAVLNDPGLPIEIDKAWSQVDDSLGASGQRLVLYLDSLDTAFKADLVARRGGLEHLFIAWQATFARLRHVQIKVFLRTDLWDSLSFPEKSHVRTRTMPLNWDQGSLWRLVLKRALAASSFAPTCRESGVDPVLTTESVEVAGDAALNAHLDVLFEQRIWTGKNSLSRNWIMRRLADAKSRVFPRDVLCLLAIAMEEEERRVRDGQRTAGDAVLSRESLARALPPTSAQRVDAVREEYPELVDILQSLQGLPANGSLEALRKHLSAPPAPGDVQPLDALEKAGVIRLDKYASDEPSYAVPALYLHGLNMTRPGPT